MIVKFYASDEDGEELKRAMAEHEAARIRLETERAELERDRMNQQKINDYNFQRSILCAFAIAAVFAGFLYYLVSDIFCATFNSMLSLVGLSDFHAGLYLLCESKRDLCTFAHILAKY
jgi:hypothetical protein